MPFMGSSVDSAWLRKDQWTWRLDGGTFLNWNAKEKMEKSEQNVQEL